MSQKLILQKNLPQARSLPKNPLIPPKNPIFWLIILLMVNYVG